MTINDSDLIERIELYSRQFIDDAPFDVDIEPVTIDIGSAKRSAGLTYVDRSDDSITVRFSRNAYDKWGWNDQFKDTIKHELIHVWQYQEHGVLDHGATFKEMAGHLNVPQHCQKFTDYNYLLYCSSCGEFIDGRYQESKIVRNPGQYRSPCCHADLFVEDND